MCRHKSYTLPFETRKNIMCVALSPSGSCMVCADEDGRAALVNYRKRVVLCFHHFKRPVKAMRFSPDSKYLAVSHGEQLQVSTEPRSDLAAACLKLQAPAQPCGLLLASDWALSLPCRCGMRLLW